MSHERLAAWIDAARKRGFTDDYLRRYLIDRGVDPESVHNAFLDPTLQKDLSLNQSISSYGIVYMIVFYFLLAIFILQIVVSVGIAAYMKNFYIMVIPLFLLAIMIYDIWQRRLNKLLFIVFLMSPLLLPVYTALPLAQAALALSDLNIYIILSVYSLSLGVIMSFMFNMLEPESERILSIGIFFSSIIAFVFAANSLFIRIIHIFYQKVQEFSQMAVISLFNSASLDSNIAFSLAYISFTIPFACFFMGRKEKKKIALLGLLIPAVIYVIFSLLLGIALDQILSALNQ